MSACQLQKKKKKNDLALLFLLIWVLCVSSSRVQLRAWVDMLSVCVCLCALFTHVLCQEAVEPISYTVSATAFRCTGIHSSYHISVTHNVVLYNCVSSTVH